MTTLEIIDLYKKLHPTTKNWQLDPTDPHYIWDGLDKTYPLCVMTLSKEDSEFILFSYKYTSKFVEALEQAAIIFKSYKEETKVLVIQKEENQKLWSKLAHTEEIIRLLINTEDMFKQQEAITHAKEYLERNKSNEINTR